MKKYLLISDPISEAQSSIQQKVLHNANRDILAFSL